LSQHLPIIRMTDPLGSLTPATRYATTICPGTELGALPVTSEPHLFAEDIARGYKMARRTRPLGEHYLDAEAAA